MNPARNLFDYKNLFLSLMILMIVSFISPHLHARAKKVATNSSKYFSGDGLRRAYTGNRLSDSEPLLDNATDTKEYGDRYLNKRNRKSRHSLQTLQDGVGAEYFEMAAKSLFVDSKVDFQSMSDAKEKFRIAEAKLGCWSSDFSAREIFVKLHPLNADQKPVNKRKVCEIIKRTLSILEDNSEYSSFNAGINPYQGQNRDEAALAYLKKTSREEFTVDSLAQNDNEPDKNIDEGFNPFDDENIGRYSRGHLATGAGRQ